MQTFSGGAWKGRCSERRRATLRRSRLCTQVEALRHRAGLVRLQGPMKCQRTGRSCERVHLAQRLFQIVFAEIRDARRGGRPHIFGSLGLRNRDQSDGGGVAAGRLGGVGDLARMRFT